MANRADQPTPGIRIDERWLMEWFELGWSGENGLIPYLTKQADFDAYCAKQARSERSRRGWATRRRNQTKEEA